MARIVDNTNQLVSPRWAGDFGSPELGLERGPFRVDPAQWASVDYTVTLTAQASAAATSLTVAALPVAIPAGTFLKFGPDEIARVSANAAKGATSIAVDALGQQIENADSATYTVTDAAPVFIPSGTVVGRTLAERTSGDDFGPAISTDDEIFIIYFDIEDASVNPDFVAYRPYAGRTVKQNYLPGFADLASNLVTSLRARYFMTIGQD